MYFLKSDELKHSLVSEGPAGINILLELSKYLSLLLTIALAMLNVALPLLSAARALLSIMLLLLTNSLAFN